MSDPIKQHYLPVSYLKGFSNPHELRRLGKHIIYVYEKGRPVRVSTPQAEAYEKHFYTLSAPSGDKYEIEKYLSKVERDAAPIIIAAQSKQYEFSSSDKKTFAQFIALMFTRTPALREYERNFSGPAARSILKRLASEDSAAFEKEWKAYVKDDPEAPSSDYARQRILNGIFDGEEHPDMPIASMVHVAKMTAEIIEKFGWQIVHACRHESFVTSDFPIVGAQRVGKEQMRLGVGFETPESEFYFPLTSRMALRMAADFNPMVGTATSRNVRIVNDMEMRFAHRRIYASTKSEKVKMSFDKQFGAMRLGETALVPMWEGKPVL